MEHSLFPFKGKLPQVNPSVFVADGAKIIGDVTIGDDSNIWYNAVIRADMNSVEIGKGVNIQDNCILHSAVALDEQPQNSGVVRVGDYCTIGHGAIVHACTVEDHCLIGMNAVILDYAVIGRGSIVGTGAVVTKGAVIPPFSLVLGIPGKVVKSLDPESITVRYDEAIEYCELAHDSEASLQ